VEGTCPARSALRQANARQLGRAHARPCPIGRDADRDGEHRCGRGAEERRDLVVQEGEPGGPPAGRPGSRVRPGPGGWARGGRSERRSRPNRRRGPAPGRASGCGSPTRSLWVATPLAVALHAGPSGSRSPRRRCWPSRGCCSGDYGRSGVVRYQRSPGVRNVTSWPSATRSAVTTAVVPSIIRSRTRTQPWMSVWMIRPWEL
jgi:hypothetical protein